MLGNIVLARDAVPTEAAKKGEVSSGILPDGDKSRIFLAQPSVSVSWAKKRIKYTHGIFPLRGNES